MDINDSDDIIELTTQQKIPPWSEHFLFDLQWMLSSGKHCTECVMTIARSYPLSRPEMQLETSYLVQYRKYMFSRGSKSFVQPNTFICSSQSVTAMLLFCTRLSLHLLVSNCARNFYPGKTLAKHLFNIIEYLPWLLSQAILVIRWTERVRFWSKDKSGTIYNSLWQPVI